MRWAFPVDEVGIEKSEKWKRSPSLAQSESDWDKTFKRTALDI
jgi:hypothetical protein